MRNRVFGHMWRAKAQIRAVCQVLCSPLTESMATTECMNGWQRSVRYFAHAPDNLKLRMLRMLEGTVLLDVAHIKRIIIYFQTNNLPGTLYN